MCVEGMGEGARRGGADKREKQTYYLSTSLMSALALVNSLEGVRLLTQVQLLLVSRT